MRVFVETAGDPERAKFRLCVLRMACATLVAVVLACLCTLVVVLVHEKNIKSKNGEAAVPSIEETHARF